MEQVISSLWVFGNSLLYGFIIWSAYQCILSIRIMIPRHRLFYWAEDMIFWPMAAVFTFQMYFKTNYGQIRGYGVIGLLLGMIVSYFTVGSVLRSISQEIRRFYLKIKKRILLKRKAKKKAKEEKRESKRKEKEAGEERKK